MTNKEKDVLAIMLTCLILVIIMVGGFWQLGYEQGREAYLRELYLGMKETGTRIEMIYFEDLEKVYGTDTVD